MAIAIVIGAFHLVARPIASGLAPLLRSEIEFLAPAFTIQSDADDNQAIYRMTFHAYLSGTIHLGGHVLRPHPAPGTDPRTVQTVMFPVSDVFKYCPLTLIFVLAWPATGLKEFALRCLLSIPLMVILLLIDIPTAVLANLWNDVHNELGVPGMNGWLLLRRCLSDGGGLVLGSFMAGLAIGGSKALTSFTRRPPRTARFRIYSIKDIPNS